MAQDKQQMTLFEQIQNIEVHRPIMWIFIGVFSGISFCCFGLVAITSPNEAVEPIAEAVKTEVATNTPTATDTLEPTKTLTQTPEPTSVRATLEPAEMRATVQAALTPEEARATLAALGTPTDLQRKFSAAQSKITPQPAATSEPAVTLANIPIGDADLLFQLCMIQTLEVPIVLDNNHSVPDSHFNNLEVIDLLTQNAETWVVPYYGELLTENDYILLTLDAVEANLWMHSCDFDPSYNLVDFQSEIIADLNE